MVEILCTVWATHSFSRFFIVCCVSMLAKYCKFCGCFPSATWKPCAALQRWKQIKWARYQIPKRRKYGNKRNVDTGHLTINVHWQQTTTSLSLFSIHAFFDIKTVIIISFGVDLDDESKNLKAASPLEVLFWEVLKHVWKTFSIKKTEA